MVQKLWERVVGIKRAKNYYPNLLFKWEPIRENAEERVTPYGVYGHGADEVVVYSHYILVNQSTYPPDNVTITKDNPWGKEGMQPEWYQLFRLSIPIFCMYAFIVPVGIYIVLIQLSNHRKLTESDYRQRYGWVYTRYNIRSWWWFAVIMLRKLSAILVTRVTPFIWHAETPQDITTLSLVQSSINLGIVVLLAALLLYVKPFQCNVCRTKLIKIIEAHNSGGNRAGKCCLTFT